MHPAPSRRWKETQKLEKQWWIQWRDRQDMREVREQMQYEATQFMAGIQENLRIPPTPSILQIGSGAQGFVHFCQGTNFLLDPLSTFFKQNFPELISPSTKIVEGMGESLPFQDSSFDVIFYLQTIDHVDRPEATLREVLRVAKTEAGVMISAHVFSRLAAILHSSIGQIVDPMHPQSFTSRRLKQIILRALIKGKRFIVLKEEESAITIPVYPGFPKLQLLGILLGLAPKYLSLILRCDHQV